MKNIYLLSLVFFILSTSLFGQSITTSKTTSLTLPFFEDWSSSSFETNNWTTECSNWTIQNHSGNDKPCAEFTWDPQLQNDYSCSLVSDEIQAEQLKIGEIVLEFDIYPRNRNGTGTEFLQVEISDGNNWNKVAEYANDDDIEWLSESINITQYALGKNFRVRFNLTGENSFEFIYWNIDNISIYRKCFAPYDLNGEIFFDDEFGIEVYWKDPDIGSR